MEEIVLVARRVGNSVFSGRATQLYVEFNFSCDLYVCKYYGDVLLERTLRPRIMRASVLMDIERLMTRSDCSRRMIDLALREWPLDDDDRRELSVFAINAAKELIKLMPPQRNVLVMPFNVLVVCHRHVDENYLAMELADRLSIQGADSRVVPATDSSIESFEIKTATFRENDNECCSICLENFYADCEVLSMPCSHIFHKDCIKKWLKSSHYCPVCRFEMPTSLMNYRALRSPNNLCNIL